jgi:hypothetical protein
MPASRIVPQGLANCSEVRAGESRKLAQERHEPLLKKSRWCVHPAFLMNALTAAGSR